MYLLLALLLPGMVFVFLKLGGSNRFDIPVYPLPGTPLRSDCAEAVSDGYTLPDSAQARLIPDVQRVYVIIFGDREVDAQSIGQAVGEEIGPRVEFVSGETLSADPIVVQRWKSCVFLLSAPWQTALVDGSGKIRGFYDLRSRDEVDRLRVELKILLEMY